MTRYLILFLAILGFAVEASAQAQDNEFRFSYIIIRGNQVSTTITPGATLTFPDTLVNTTNPAQSQITSATFVVANTSVLSGRVNNIIPTGVAFKLSGVPVLPATVGPGQTLTFTINFQPTDLARFDGTLRIDLNNPVTFNLTGNGVGPVLTYDFTIGSTTRTVVANDTLTLPQTGLGDKTTATMRVRNSGNFEANVNSIASSDPSFALENVPFLPLTLPAGGNVSFNINFVPTQAGTLTARLKVGDVTFNLSGLALGATLTFRAVAGSATTTLGSNGTVIFTPAQVGSTSSIQIQVSNTGSTAAFVNSISATGPATGVFTLTNLPALPVKIDEGTTVSFGVAFAPTTLGQVTGTLRIDNQTFTLSGVGNPPPPLPGVTFAGVTTAVDAAQQIGVGVTLDTAYPVQLDGKLVISFSPSADVFSDDPAIAFATGGRTVNFSIPANSRTAVFGLNDSQVRFQTGTVAGTINLVATFATNAGGINLTVTNPPATNIGVRASSPRITSVQLVNRTAGAFTIAITGYSPTRSLNTMDFKFTPYVDPTNKDLKLDTTTANFAVNGPFNVWYLSTPSQAFGSLFTATVTFNVRGNIEAVQSLDVTMSNSVGASNSRSVTLR